MLPDGSAVGVVVTGTEETGSIHGPQPALTKSLPAWLIAALTQAGGSPNRSLLEEFAAEGDHMPGPEWSCRKSEP